jgi:hypothetical protein
MGCNPEKYINENSLVISAIQVTVFPQVKGASLYIMSKPLLTVFSL